MGLTAQFVVPVKYNPTLSHYLTVDGETVNVTLAETDTTYTGQKGMSVFKLGTAPSNGAIIQYAIFHSASKSFSQITTDTFTGDGNTKAFTLAQALIQESLEHNVIVKVGNNILNAGYNQRFVVSATREYKLKDYPTPQAGIDANKVRVFLNGEEITITQSWSWNTFNAS